MGIIMEAPFAFFVRTTPGEEGSVISHITLSPVIWSKDSKTYLALNRIERFEEF